MDQRGSAMISLQDAMTKRELKGLYAALRRAYELTPGDVNDDPELVKMVDAAQELVDKLRREKRKAEANTRASVLAESRRRHAAGPEDASSQRKRTKKIRGSLETAIRARDLVALRELLQAVRDDPQLKFDDLTQRATALKDKLELRQKLSNSLRHQVARCETDANMTSLNKLKATLEQCEQAGVGTQSSDAYAHTDVPEFMDAARCAEALEAMLHFVHALETARRSTEVKQHVAQVIAKDYDAVLENAAHSSSAEWYRLFFGRTQISQSVAEAKELATKLESRQVLRARLRTALPTAKRKRNQDALDTLIGLRDQLLERDSFDHRDSSLDDDLFVAANKCIDELAKELHVDAASPPIISSSLEMADTGSPIANSFASPSFVANSASDDNDDTLLLPEMTTSSAHHRHLYENSSPDETPSQNFYHEQNILVADSKPLNSEERSTWSGRIRAMFHRGSDDDNMNNEDSEQQENVIVFQQDQQSASSVLLPAPATGMFGQLRRRLFNDDAAASSANVPAKNDESLISSSSPPPEKNEDNDWRLPEPVVVDTAAAPSVDDDIIQTSTNQLAARLHAEQQHHEPEEPRIGLGTALRNRFGDGLALVGNLVSRSTDGAAAADKKKDDDLNQEDLFAGAAQIGGRNQQLGQDGEVNSDTIEPSSSGFFNTAENTDTDIVQSGAITTTSFDESDPPVSETSPGLLSRWFGRSAQAQSQQQQNNAHHQSDVTDDNDIEPSYGGDDTEPLSGGTNAMMHGGKKHVSEEPVLEEDALGQNNDEMIGGGLNAMIHSKNHVAEEPVLEEDALGQNNDEMIGGGLNAMIHSKKHVAEEPVLEEEEVLGQNNDQLIGGSVNAMMKHHQVQAQPEELNFGENGDEEIVGSAYNAMRGGDSLGGVDDDTLDFGGTSRNYDDDAMVVGNGLARNDTQSNDKRDDDAGNSQSIFGRALSAVANVLNTTRSALHIQNMSKEEHFNGTNENSMNSLNDFGNDPCVGYDSHAKNQNIEDSILDNETGEGADYDRSGNDIPFSSFDGQSDTVEGRSPQQIALEAAVLAAVENRELGALYSTIKTGYQLLEPGDTLMGETLAHATDVLHDLQDETDRRQNEEALLHKEVTADLKREASDDPFMRACVDNDLAALDAYLAEHVPPRQTIYFDVVNALQRAVAAEDRPAIEAAIAAVDKENIADGGSNALFSHARNKVAAMSKADLLAANMRRQDDGTFDREAYENCKQFAVDNGLESYLEPKLTEASTYLSTEEAIAGTTNLLHSAREKGDRDALAAAIAEAERLEDDVSGENKHFRSELEDARRGLDRLEAERSARATLQAATVVGKSRRALATAIEDAYITLGDDVSGVADAINAAKAALEALKTKRRSSGSGRKHKSSTTGSFSVLSPAASDARRKKLLAEERALIDSIGQRFSENNSYTPLQIPQPEDEVPEPAVDFVEKATAPSPMTPPAQLRKIAPPSYRDPTLTPSLRALSFARFHAVRLFSKHGDDENWGEVVLDREDDEKDLSIWLVGLIAMLEVASIVFFPLAWIGVAAIVYALHTPSDDEHPKRKVITDNITSSAKRATLAGAAPAVAAVTSPLAVIAVFSDSAPHTVVTIFAAVTALIASLAWPTLDECLRPLRPVNRQQGPRATILALQPLLALLPLFILSMRLAPHAAAAVWRSPTFIALVLACRLIDGRDQAHRNILAARFCIIFTLGAFIASLAIDDSSLSSPLAPIRGCAVAWLLCQDNTLSRLKWHFMSLNTAAELVPMAHYY